MREVEPESSWRMLHPRPVVIVGAGDPERRVNFAPVSWVTPVSDEPPAVAIALDEESFTLELLSETGEFSLCVLPSGFVNEILYLGSVSGRKADKLSAVGWGWRPAKAVKAPVLEKSIGILECKKLHELEIGEVRLVVGEIVRAEAEEGLFNDRYGWDLKKVKIPLHAAGRTFVEPGRLLLADASRFKKRKKS